MVFLGMSRFCGCCITRKKSNFRQQKSYMNAQKRFYEQLDIVNILKTIRRADFFMKAKLTQRQLFLLKI